jgi:8-oxo-dGTP diphosphatase
MIHIYVGGLLIESHETRCILLGHRSPSRSFSPNVWDMPGGHCEQEELPEITLVRELREEIGVTPLDWYKLGTLEEPDTREGRVTFHVFVVTKWSGEPTNLAPDEHDALRWVPLDDACRLQLAHPAYQVWFQKLRSA